MESQKPSNSPQKSSTAKTASAKTSGGKKLKRASSKDGINPKSGTEG
jgi:hypothetical protein